MGVRSGGRGDLNLGMLEQASALTGSMVGMVSLIRVVMGPFFAWLRTCVRPMLVSVTDRRRRVGETRGSVAGHHPGGHQHSQYQGTKVHRGFTVSQNIPESRFRKSDPPLRPCGRPYSGSSLGIGRARRRLESRARRARTSLPLGSPARAPKVETRSSQYSRNRRRFLRKPRQRRAGWMPPISPSSPRELAAQPRNESHTLVAPCAPTSGVSSQFSRGSEPSMKRTPCESESRRRSRTPSCVSV